MNKIVVLLHSTWLALFYVAMCDAGKVKYISMKRSEVLYNNPKYIPYINITSSQLPRQIPVHFLDMHFDTAVGMGNNFTVTLYFYEYLSNGKLRKLFDLSYKLCNLVHKDMFLGPILRQGKFTQQCPYPVGDYHLYNITIPYALIPSSLPFTKGQLVCNVSITDTSIVFASAYVDLEIKELRSKLKED